MINYTRRYQNHNTSPPTGSTNARKIARYLPYGGNRSSSREPHRRGTESWTTGFNGRGTPDRLLGPLLTDIRIGPLRHRSTSSYSSSIRVGDLLMLPPPREHGETVTIPLDSDGGPPFHRRIRHTVINPLSVLDIDRTRIVIGEVLHRGFNINEKCQMFSGTPPT